MKILAGNFEYDDENKILYIKLKNSEVTYYGEEATKMAIKLVGGKVNE